MSVAVVVVSYNRKELLRDCLTSVCAQVAPQDEVIVIDNGSTDGSPELVRGEFPQATLFETGENLGGSGGFAWGVELAIAKGHSWAGLMDDDGTPAADALDNLKRVVTAAPTTPSFAACLVTGTPGSSSEHPPAPPSPNCTLDSSSSSPRSVMRSTSFVRSSTGFPRSIRIGLAAMASSS